jgi:O-acetylhomoserine (thiol)-lyase
MVGVSSNWNRPSYFRHEVSPGKGYKVVAVDPGLAGQTLQRRAPSTPRLRRHPAGERVRSTWSTCFRSQRPPPARSPTTAIAIGAKVLWMQFGVRNDEAAAAPRGGRPRSRHEPLPEDRVRPPRAASSPGPASTPRIIRNRPPEAPIQPARRAERAGRQPALPGCETPRPIHAGAAADPPTGARARRRSTRPPSYVCQDVDHAAAALQPARPSATSTRRLTNPTVAGAWKRRLAVGGRPRRDRLRRGPRRPASSPSSPCSTPGDHFLAAAPALWRLAHPSSAGAPPSASTGTVDLRRRPTDPERRPRRADADDTKAIFVESLADSRRHRHRHRGRSPAVAA